MVVVSSETGMLNALHKRARAKGLAATTSNQMEWVYLIDWLAGLGDGLGGCVWEFLVREKEKKE